MRVRRSVSLAFLPLEDRTTPVRFQFDYTFDTLGFFNDPARRAALEKAGADLGGRLTDSLAALVPGNGNTLRFTMTNPATEEEIVVADPAIPADTIVVFAQGAPLPGNLVGYAGAIYTAATGTADWLHLVQTRGWPDAKVPTNADFVPAVGFASFEVDANESQWYFGLDLAGRSFNQADFYSVAMHELTHVLGFGQSQAFRRLTSDGQFVGPASVARYGGPVPLEGGHWQIGLEDQGQPVLMSAEGTIGRDYLTGLDLAALDDIGWTSTNVQTATVAMTANRTVFSSHIQAHAAVASAGSDRPTGFVDFYSVGTTNSNRRFLGTVPLNADGTADFAIDDFATTLVAIYSGDADYLPSSSPRTTIQENSVVPPVSPGPVNPKPGFAFAVGAGQGGNVVLRAADGSDRGTAIPFAGFGGAVRVATADFTGDGQADLVAGTGPGRSTRIVVLDGKSGDELFALDPFEAGFTGGVFVAAGDLTGDGIPDLVVTPDEGGGPRVRVFNGNGFGLIADFLGIDDPDFRGGCRPAIGDLNHDGAGDLLVAAGFGGGPRVAGFDGRRLGERVKLFADFLAFEPQLRNGVYVAAGDLDGDGFAELVAGGGPGGGPRVTAFSGQRLLASEPVVLTNFFAGDAANRGGVRVAMKDLDGDARTDLLVGDAGGSRVVGYTGSSLAASAPAELFALDAFPGLTGGVFVG